MPGFNGFRLLLKSQRIARRKKTEQALFQIRSQIQDNAEPQSQIFKKVYANEKRS